MTFKERKSSMTNNDDKDMTKLHQFVKIQVQKLAASIRSRTSIRECHRKHDWCCK